MEVIPPTVNGSSAASHQEEEGSVPPAPITSTPLNTSAAPSHDDEQEECEICWELAPKSDFLTLPCKYGHRFMKECITRWGNELTHDRVAQCQCPKCRQEFRYQICGHYLERSRMQSDERGLLVHDIAMNYCMRCRERERNIRRRAYILLVQAGQRPNWASFQPGDLFLPILLERDTPPHLTEKYKDVQEEHAFKIQRYRDEAAQFDKESLVEGTIAFGRYWKLRSQIADYDRAESFLYGAYDPAVYGAFLDGEDGEDQFSDFSDEDQDSEDHDDEYNGDDYDMENEHGDDDDEDHGDGDDDDMENEHDGDEIEEDDQYNENV